MPTLWGGVPDTPHTTRATIKRKICNTYMKKSKFVCKFCKTIFTIAKFARKKVKKKFAFEIFDA